MTFASRASVVAVALVLVACGGSTSDAPPSSGGASRAGSAGNSGASGSAGDAGSGGTAGTGGVTHVTIDIDLGQTKFLDYGKLQIAFSEAVDASSLEIKLAPPVGAAKPSVAQVDPTTVLVTLDYYH